MDDAEAQNHFKWVEIAVSMQQFVIGVEAKRSDQTIDRFTDCVTSGSQFAVILSRSDG